MEKRTAGENRVDMEKSRNSGETPINPKDKEENEREYKRIEKINRNKHWAKRKVKGILEK